MVYILVDLYPISGAHNTRPADRMRPTESQDAAHWIPTENVSILAHNCLCYIGPHKHGYERKNVAIVSVKRHQLQGDFVS